MNVTFGKRQWVKLWTNEWLDGTTRYQMADAQRAFWIDLLAMAGRSRFPGIICAGRDGEHFVGYPLNRFQSLMAEPIDIDATLQLFERTGKIKLTVSSEGPPKLYVIELLNWRKYQSDLDAQAQRSKKYRDRKRHRNGGVAEGVTRPSRCVTGIEGDGETEKESDKEAEEISTSTSAFSAIGFDEPFGQKEFQRIWLSRFSQRDPDQWLTAVMEATIQECQERNIGIPPQFFGAKRDVEARENEEAKRRFKRTPL
jgi:hypothetical protein